MNAEQYIDEQVKGILNNMDVCDADKFNAYIQTKVTAAYERGSQQSQPYVTVTWFFKKYGEAIGWLTFLALAVLAIGIGVQECNQGMDEAIERSLRVEINQQQATIKQLQQQTNEAKSDLQVWRDYVRLSDCGDPEPIETLQNSITLEHDTPMPVEVELVVPDSE